MSLATIIDVEPEQLIPVERRRFGPAFEKPCRNRDTIICAIARCRQAYKCQGTTPAPGTAPEPEAIAYGTIWYKSL